MSLICSVLVIAGAKVQNKYHSVHYGYYQMGSDPILQNESGAMQYHKPDGIQHGTCFHPQVINPISQVIYVYNRFLSAGIGLVNLLAEMVKNHAGHSRMQVILARIQVKLTVYRVRENHDRVSCR